MPLPLESASAVPQQKSPLAILTRSFGQPSLQSEFPSPSVILAASLYQNQKFISLDGHVYSWHADLMNDNVYSNLTSDEQKTVYRGVDMGHRRDI